MQMKWIVAVILCVVAAAGTPALAETLAEKELHGTEAKNMVSSIEQVKRQCEADIPIEWDWSGFTKSELEERGTASFCGAAYSAMANICYGSKDGMKAVQENIKKVLCKRTPTRVIELKNGELTFGVDYNSANDEEAVREYLKNNI